MKMLVTAFRPEIETVRETAPQLSYEQAANLIIHHDLIGWLHGRFEYSVYSPPSSMMSANGVSFEIALLDEKPAVLCRMLFPHRFQPHRDIDEFLERYMELGVYKGW